MNGSTRWRTRVAERARIALAALVAIGLLGLTGCSADMNTTDVQDRLVAATDLNGALVEVQHPGAPWNDKIVVWMFVDDGSAQAVADDVRDVAGFAADDADLSDEELTLIAVKGRPEDFPERHQLAVAGEYVMGEVASLVGGSGSEDQLVLGGADVRRLADQ